MVKAGSPACCLYFPVNSVPRGTSAGRSHRMRRDTRPGRGLYFPVNFALRGVGWRNARLLLHCTNPL
jgi:hypothetical protein